MALHVALTHVTSYKYDRPVALGPQTIRLRPAPHTRTPIISYSLTIEPKPHFINWLQDPQGNHLARVVFPERVTHFDVTIDLVADMVTINPFDFFLEPEAEESPFAYDPVLQQELAPYRRLTPPGPLLAAFLADTPREKQRTIDLLVELNRRVNERVGYIVRMEPGVMTPDETLGKAEGSCRDSAWLLVHVLRHLGFAARFVSGYLIQLTADVKPVDGPAGPTADFTDLHAWAEVYLPGAGWVGLDATSGLFTGEGHIPLAASPDPISAAPITGLMEKAEVSFDFRMAVSRVVETPRTTKPYTDEQWHEIVASGYRVDRALAASDMRLTMGGEPTFVSASDMEGAEWNFDAMGPTKRRMAGRLIRRLAPLWSPGAALQYVMGKQYPGEQVPRWGLYAHWRTDGEAVWRDPDLLASDDDTGDATPADAARFCAALAERLQVDPSLVNPAYEDIHYYLWREQRLPANVIAEDSKLRDRMERERLARLFAKTGSETGLDKPVGSVLPLRRVIRDGTRIWQSGKWFFRGGEMFLVPGDSPIGFRLPLQSLLWASDEKLALETDHEIDPFAPVASLPSRSALSARRPGPAFGAPAGQLGEALTGESGAPNHGGSVNGAGTGTAQLRRLPLGPGGPLESFPGEAFRTVAQELPVIGREEPDLVRTALAVESRGGLLHIFLPPLYGAEDWLDLVAAVESTAMEMGRKVILEGYLPPRDSRLLNFSVTPDPGVIEVNVHPATKWSEIVERGEQLYEQARQVGLASEKFMLDGRHVGTGGGNHVVMGAARAEDSPFLRRPDLLKSMIGFWHNHPSLSFLFSGLFIGPSSQHPRIDEARMDAVAELETAFQRIQPFAPVPPWMTDRLLRNILVDVTGNTHRTEFCIDKMYAPESATGRLGLVEFRALEMPPHARMAAVQILLMRSALAAFWQSPYERRLVRWGTRVHDDFMLPHFVEQDFRDALEELGGLGFRLDPAWFVPHMEFRFPRIGDITVDGIKVELRQALEPWHVLGDEPAAGGTARYVDSSVERVQALLSGWAAERYLLACNGHAVPLTQTERTGEYVGAVRFKAWNPPSALHPTVPAQSPLVFDIYDRWSGRSVGGLTHHVSHPGGRSYDDFPVNANAAEARRRSRFFPFGHTPGSMPEPRPVTSLEHPRTLDLRRAH